MTRLLTASTAFAAALLFLTACGAHAGGGAEDSGTTGETGDAGGGGSSAASACAEVASNGYELFVDERVSVSPSAGAYSLETSGDSISFADTPPNDFTTYGYSRYYIDNGTVFPNGGSIFVGAEDTNSFRLDGPLAPSGIDGGPYPGFIEIEATDATGTSVIARLCVVFAAG